MPIEHEVLTVKEVCGILQIDKSPVYKLATQGKIPSFKIGKDWRFRTDAIVHWMAEQTKGGPQ